MTSEFFDPVTAQRFGHNFDPLSAQPPPEVDEPVSEL